jgi:hypothetical protein
MRYGDSNDAGGSNTSLTSSTGQWTLLVSNTTGGTGVLGESPAGGRGVHGYNDANGIGVFGENTGTGEGGPGYGVFAKSTPYGYALYVEGLARFQGNVALADYGSFNGKGTGITNINASSLAFGTVDDERLSANVPLLDGNTAFTASLSAPVVSAGSFNGNGASVTGMDASNLSSGTVADARLSSNVPLRAAGANTFAGAIRAALLAGPSGGPPVFPDVGTVIIKTGKASGQVIRPMGAKDVVIAVLQSNPGPGVLLRFVRKLASSFRVVLTRRAAADTTVAYVIVRGL